MSVLETQKQIEGCGKVKYIVGIHRRIQENNGINIGKYNKESIIKNILERYYHLKIRGIDGQRVNFWW